MVVIGGLASMDSKQTSSETLLEGMKQVGFKGDGCDDSSRKRTLQEKIQVTGPIICAIGCPNWSIGMFSIVVCMQRYINQSP